MDLWTGFGRYRCSKNGGYAALRMVNDCDGARVTYVWARECGRGFVSGRCYNINVDRVDIEGSTSDAILLTLGSVNVQSMGGTYTGQGIVHYTCGTGCAIYAQNLGNGGGLVSGGIYRLTPR